MRQASRQPNHLINEKSPYLLQHVHNPVDWYPWGQEAFDKAKAEDKPIFLSIGYSTCHWCHVMAHESFEDREVADLLNEYFVAIKVDKEERPDIDSIYMNVCQAFSGSGGWPMSIFMTSEQKPFFAGTYFSRSMFIGLLVKIKSIWDNNREEVLRSCDEVVAVLNQVTHNKSAISDSLISKAVEQFKSSFDSVNGGFGPAPKFPVPHNLLFLLDFYEKTQNRNVLEMVEKTLISMYKGGMFDHVGFGFSRYSTDEFFLIPHFEKMLYDNALLMMSYISAYQMTNKSVYKEVAIKISKYIAREMTSNEGAFFSAQDADSDGVEGKFYTFSYDEIEKLLDDEAPAFCKYYGITKSGNFEGKNIINLMDNTIFDPKFEKYLPVLYEYRKNRASLHLDDKILTSWNSLMIAAFATMYKMCGDESYLKIAQNANQFIETRLLDGNSLFVSYRDFKRSTKAFLDDYAYYIFALFTLYDATHNRKYLSSAKGLIQKCIHEYFDFENGGFYLYGADNEQLIFRPKETYDGALPSGNSAMTYNLVKFVQLVGDTEIDEICQKQLEFMSGAADRYPIGHSFYLLALSRYLDPPIHIVCAVKNTYQKMPVHSDVILIQDGNSEYPIKNDKTTYYVCTDHHCFPPVNDLNDVLREYS